MYSNECKNLEKIIGMASFAMDDARLYLDTHPGDVEAMEYFHKYHHIREHAMQEYTSKCGPMCAYNVEADNHWTWNCGPWPWEKEV